MIFLIGSILLSSWLTLSFKILERKGIPSFDAIVVNYCVCVLTGSLLAGKIPFSQEVIQADWFPWAILMGSLFIGLFNVIGYTTQQLGISVVSVANKLSLVIPFLFSIILYQESIGFLKWMGVGIALISVVLVAYRPGEDTHLDHLKWLLPAILFVGSGLLDTLIKYCESKFVDEHSQNDFLITAFATAAVIGLLLLFYKIKVQQLHFDKRSVWAGIAIGVPNYFSIWCLMLVLKQYAGNSSAIFPINNMGIVLFSAVMAWLFFKEKMSVINWTGIALSLLAIVLIAFG